MFHDNQSHHRERHRGHHHPGGWHGQAHGHPHHEEDERGPGNMHGHGGPGPGGHGPGGFGRGRGHGHGGGRSGGRAKRGALRYVLLDTLRDGPKHGYEIIKAFEERTQGQYGPSPGTVYPTLQYLEELGLVRADQSAERRVYHLTEAGQADLEVHAEEVKAFWAEFGRATVSSTCRHEVGFLHDEIEDLIRTIRAGVIDLTERDDPATIRLVRQAVEQCKSEVRRIIAEPRTSAPPSAPQA
jgi:DNA-binding PadR family transcriptional regulator